MLRLHVRLLWGTFLAELRRRMRQPLPVHGNARTLSRPEWEQQDVVGQECDGGGNSLCLSRASRSQYVTNPLLSDIATPTPPRLTGIHVREARSACSAGSKPGLLMNASAVHPLHSSRATGPRDPLLRLACHESKPTGGKVLIRCDLIERSGSSEAWYGGRARRSFGQRTVSSTPPSRRPLGSEACLVDSYEAGQPSCTIPPKEAHPLREPPGGVPPPRTGAPGTHCASVAMGGRDAATGYPLLLGS
jgi:hypothetical protein